MHTIRFYFSFRSPYSWIAAELLGEQLAGVAHELELVPIYPLADSWPNDPARVPNKLRYVMHDVVRLCTEHALSLTFGAAIDTDWARAHAAFLGAQRLGAGEAFMLEMFRARFTRALDVALDAVIADCAERARLPAQPLLEAASSPELQRAAAQSFELGQQRDGIFGVPSFVFQGQLFWGHDRLAALRHALASA
ncbi:MAG: DsbA family protein [Polyangiales bacterium]